MKLPRLDSEHESIGEPVPSEKAFLIAVVIRKNSAWPTWDARSGLEPAFGHAAGCRRYS